MRKVYNLIGIAQRAGKTSSGAMATQSSLIGNRAHVLLMSEDISTNTRESLVKSCRKRNIPWITLGSRYDLGASMGKAYRVALTINDAGIANAIVKAIEAVDKDAKSMGVVEWPR
ncbi:MAG: ribosomal L7Ae/L30e/S12e/Gadd45 family protein [Syntrophomonas sp.]|nr:ribosomal L7Ae/L30e/S12e/Gadd45 family protein [Syntrophomonas sp.]